MKHLKTFEGAFSDVDMNAEEEYLMSKLLIGAYNAGDLPSVERHMLDDVTDNTMSDYMPGWHGVEISYAYNEQVSIDLSFAWEPTLKQMDARVEARTFIGDTEEVENTTYEYLYVARNFDEMIEIVDSLFVKAAELANELVGV